MHGITTVDNPFEYPDRPPDTAVIRASKNWVARLALAAIPMTDKKALIMGSGEICWACAKESLPYERVSIGERLFLC